MKARLVTILLAGLVGLPGPGCFRWEAMKTTDLPKVGTLGVKARSESRVDVNAARIETPDGRILDVGSSPVIRVTAYGKKYTFESPIRARLEGNRLVVQGSNLPRTYFQLKEITQVAVRRFNPGSIIWGILGGVVGAGVILAIVLTQAR